MDSKEIDVNRTMTDCTRAYRYPVHGYGNNLITY